MPSGLNLSIDIRASCDLVAVSRRVSTKRATLLSSVDPKPSVTDYQAKAWFHSPFVWGDGQAMHLGALHQTKGYTGCH